MIVAMTYAEDLDAGTPASHRPPGGREITAPPLEWIGRLGDVEPNPYAAMTSAERIEMVWPLTVTAWAFSGEASDESRLRRDVESVGRRRR